MVLLHYIYLVLGSEVCPRYLRALPELGLTLTWIITPLPSVHVRVTFMLRKLLLYAGDVVLFVTFLAQ